MKPVDAIFEVKLKAYNFYGHSASRFVRVRDVSADEIHVPDPRKRYQIRELMAALQAMPRVFEVSFCGWRARDAVYSHLLIGGREAEVVPSLWSVREVLEGAALFGAQTPGNDGLAYMRDGLRKLESRWLRKHGSLPANW